MKKKEWNLKCHLFYIVLILMMSNIITFTVKLGNITNLVDYLLFGLSLTSFVLAFVTIIYSIISNFKSSEVFGNIRSASENMDKTATDMANTNNYLRDQIIKIIPQLKDLKDTSVQTHSLVKQALEETTATSDQISPRNIKRFTQACHLKDCAFYI